MDTEIINNIEEITEPQLYEILTTILKQFYSNDSILLEKDIHELTISARFMFYFQNLIPHYNVDIEYNRHIDDIKELLYNDSTIHKVRPDIIIHKRGNDEHNLLILELKKECNTQDNCSSTENMEECKDINRLKQFTEESKCKKNDNTSYNYKYGIWLICAKNECLIFLFKKGKLISKKIYNVKKQELSNFNTIPRICKKCKNKIRCEIINTLIC